jgi:hypothetical protein
MLFGVVILSHSFEAHSITLNAEQQRWLLGTYTGSNGVATLYVPIRVDGDYITWGRGTPQACRMRYVIESSGSGSTIPDEFGPDLSPPTHYWYVKLRLESAHCKVRYSHVQFAFDTEVGAAVSTLFFRAGRRDSQFSTYKDYWSLTR